MAGWVHQPVMPVETLHWLQVRPGGRYLDATLGSGGHTALILEQLNGNGEVLGLDQDPEALERVRHRLGAPPGLHLRQENFENMVTVMENLGWTGVDGIVMDLGCSSDQIDAGRRGFSFQQDGPLDMRMNPGAGIPASEWLHHVPERELARALRVLGEEPASNRIARAIVRRREKRPFLTTLDLAEVVAQAAGGRRSRIHPATRTFQAIRMVINREMEVLEVGLEAAIACLRPQGRLVAIDFHSKEDRAVKQCFSRHIGREVSLYEGGSRWEGMLPRLNRLTRKPVMASEEEISENPRARSAKLRAVEKTDGQA